MVKTINCFQNPIFFNIGIELLKDNNNSYDKIKHLVEVDDDILAVFIIISLLCCITDYSWMICPH